VLRKRLVVTVPRTDAPFFVRDFRVDPAVQSLKGPNPKRSSHPSEV